MKTKDKVKLNRMRFRQKKSDRLLYPEDQGKVYWDLFIALVLIISCILTPYSIAFDQNSRAWDFLGYTIDVLFFIDIMVIFNSAFYDDEF
jgi:hypothetical protein